MTTMPWTAAGDPLEESPDLQIIAGPTIPKLIDLLALWQSWPKAIDAQGRGLPGRGQFEPADIPHLLPDLCLIEYDRNSNPYRDYDALFRYIGSQIGDLFQMEQHTRQHMSNFGATYAPRWFRVFDHQRQTRAPFAVRGIPYLIDKTFLRFELLFLPLARDDARATTTDSGKTEVAFSIFVAHIEPNLSIDPPQS